ncbi:MAG: hypothetical protein AAF532_07430 [Planctomycetota bacterium]
MASPGEKDADHCAIGFLTTIDLPGGGHVGGLLVTNRFGRPLEFQCTTPVKPDKTQQILFGATLRPYVLGEVIGKTLLDKATVKPDVVLTDDDAVLDVRDHAKAPTGRVLNDGDGPARVGRQTVRVHAAHAGDEASIASRTRSVPESADMLEPFERVREALRETVEAGARR